MDRVEVLKGVNIRLHNEEKEKVNNSGMERENIDMKRFINKFKKRDFKLRRLFETLEKGWSFSSMETFIKDGRRIS